MTEGVPSILAQQSRASFAVRKRNLLFCSEEISVAVAGQELKLCSDKAALALSSECDVLPHTPT